jgi:hypothetical protein
MAIPLTVSGLPNHYESQIAVDGQPIFAIAIDTLQLPARVALVKIDAEGHEAAVLRGMRGLLRRDHPVIILEANSEADVLLRAAGYRARRFAESSNDIYEH